MSTSKWISVWDDTFAVTGSVYLTPTYLSGTENGLAMRHTPATLHFTAGQGAPARDMNGVLFGLGDTTVKIAQHQAMRFFSGKDWTSSAVQCAAVARSSRGFIIGSSTTVSVIREPRSTGALPVCALAVGISKVVIDDGFHIAEFEQNAGGETRWASASTVTSSALTSGCTFPLAARSIAGNSLLVGTSGTAMIAYTWSGTATTPVATTVSFPGGTYGSSSVTIWSSAQVFLGALTATGPAIFFSRGVLTNNYLTSTDGATLNNRVWPAALTATADKLIDVAYDDVQGLFVAAGYLSTTTSQKAQFFTSPDAITWTASTTASGPAGLKIFGGQLDGATTFAICGGIWLLATTGNQFAGFVYGSSVGVRVTAVYSLDYGVTWYPCALDMVTPTGGVLRSLSSVDQILIMHDGDIALSGRLGYQETV